MTLRGACHIHSQYSYDGILSLREVRDLLLKQGGSFAIMTEHTDELNPIVAQEFIGACFSASDDRFRFVPGFEVPYLGTHILVIGAHRYHEGDSQEILAQWQKEGALLIVAHPHRNGYHLDQFLRDRSDGIEIWNSQYDGIHAPRTRAVRLYRDLNRIRSSVAAYGSLDLHREAHRFGPQIALEASEMSEVAIVSALRAGAFSIVRGRIAVSADSTVLRGNAVVIRLLGYIMPAAVDTLKAFSSIFSHLGLRSFALKKWIRTRI